MKFVQKKKSVKHTFTFNDDILNFEYQDKTGSGDTDFSYADLPKKSSIQIERNEWLRNVGYLWIAVSVFQICYALYSGGSISGKGFWMIIGSGCVLWSFLTTIKYTVFQTERGNIFVIQDKNHDDIVSEFQQRRKAQLLLWYGEVNLENNLDQEVQKFNWLVNEDIISKEESEQKIAQAKMLQQNNIQLLPGEKKLN